MLTSVDKALVPGVVMLILGGLGWVGITGDMTVADALTALVTMGFVWLVPNKKEESE